MERSAQAAAAALSPASNPTLQNKTAHGEGDDRGGERRVGCFTLASPPATAERSRSSQRGGGGLGRGSVGCGGARFPRESICSAGAGDWWGSWGWEAAGPTCIFPFYISLPCSWPLLTHRPLDGKRADKMEDAGGQVTEKFVFVFEIDQQDTGGVAFCLRALSVTLFAS